MASKFMWTVSGVVLGAGLTFAPAGLSESTSSQPIDTNSANATGAISTPTPKVEAGNYHPMVSFAPLVEALEPAVVAIEVETTQNAMERNPLLERFFGLPPEAFGPQTVQGEGSGFIISQSGLLLTNHHVIARADTIRARFSDGETVKARLLGSDANMDVALLKLEGSKKWPHVNLGSSKDARVGDWVVAMGNPLGLGHTVTAGIVSGKGRILHHDRVFGSDDFIQTDAAINQGNSGGPLFDLNGNVIGINTAIIQGANTIGFAVPMDPIKQIIDDLENKGFVSRGYLGVQPQRLTPELASAIGSTRTKGALIARVFQDTAAEKYGLQAGDIVTQIDSTEIEDPETLIQVVATKRPETSISIYVIRKGKSKVLDLVLGERPDRAPERAAPTGEKETESLSTLGMELSTISGHMKEQTGIHNGVLVEAIESDSPARERLQPGDIILSVNQRPVDSVEDVTYALKRSSGSVFFLVSRGDVQRFVVVPLK
jgi:serine protease Do